MAELLFIRTTPLGLFFRRRIARVWPGLAFFVLVMAVNPFRLDAWNVGPADIAAALTFTVNYNQLFRDMALVFEHVWSLSVEEHGYVLLAIIAFCARHRAINVPALLLGLAALAVLNGAVQSVWGGGGHFQVYWRTDVRVASILIACAIHLHVTEQDWRLPGWWGYAPVGLGLAGLVLNLQVMPDWVKYSIGTFCIALAVGLIDRGAVRLRALLEHPVLVRFGLWSFSLYVWQQAFYALKDDLPRTVEIRLLLIACSIACGVASFYLVEQPCRRFLNRYWRPSVVAPHAS